MLTRYGLFEIAVFGGGSFLLASAFFGAVFWTNSFPIQAVFSALSGIFFLAVLLILNFFRDPERKPPEGERLLLSPADGVVSDIETAEEPLFLRGKAIRVGIFMDVFNVHVNRMPLSGTVGFLKHEAGEFRAVFTAEAALKNEKQWIGLNGPGLRARMTVCQVAGFLARRIVCDLKEGQEAVRGRRFGMIKFGSRLEVYLPGEIPAELKVKIGDKTRAGETVLFELKG